MLNVFTFLLYFNRLLTIKILTIRNLSTHMNDLNSINNIELKLKSEIETTKLRNLVPHGNYNGFIDESGSAICTDCKVEKKNCNFIFYKNRVNPQTNLCLYVNKKCSDCRKLYMVHKKKSIENAKKLNVVRPVPTPQNPYKCDCCDKDIVTTKTIQLDHCHETGQFRGWLCKECNISMGNLGDNIYGLMRVIKYMNKTEKKDFDEMNVMVNDIIFETADVFKI